MARPVFKTADAIIKAERIKNTALLPKAEKVLSGERILKIGVIAIIRMPVTAGGITLVSHNVADRIKTPMFFKYTSGISVR